MRNELVKEAFLRALWDKFTGIFGGDREKRRLDAHFKAQDWDKFLQFSRSPEFVGKVEKDPRADDKLRAFTQSMHQLAKAPQVARIESRSDAGKKYEIRRLPDGRLACTCNDWRYKGSVDPGHKCKHVRAHEEMNKVASPMSAKMQAFFDELSEIDRQKRLEHDGTVDQNGRAKDGTLIEAYDPEGRTPYTVHPRFGDTPEVITRLL